MLAIAGLAMAAVIEAQLGSTRYTLNGTAYAIPHKYEFTRKFQLPWIEHLRGLDKEPEESAWLLIPASELARDISGYSRTFRGYSSEVDADIVVNVLGGKESREFPEDRSHFKQVVAHAVTSGEGQEDDRLAGWRRIYSTRGLKGTSAEGYSHFFLLPAGGWNELPAHWLPPQCKSLPDVDGHETYDCHYVILYDGLTFDFSLRHANIGAANRVAKYALLRLREWRI